MGIDLSIQHLTAVFIVFLVVLLLEFTCDMYRIITFKLAWKTASVDFFNFALEQPIKQFFMANQQMISCKFKRRRRHHEPRKKPKTCIIWVMYLVDWTGVEINWNSDACGMTFFNEGLCDIFGNAIAVGEWEWPLLSPLQHTVTIRQGRVQKDGRPKVKAQQERDWTAGQ